VTCECQAPKCDIMGRYENENMEQANSRSGANVVLYNDSKLW
jgi:hypothetical protein